jgi:hypothetical protein
MTTESLLTNKALLAIAKAMLFYCTAAWMQQAWRMNTATAISEEVAGQSRGHSPKSCSIARWPKATVRQIPSASSSINTNLETTQQQTVCTHRIEKAPTPPV